jgi:hypothetical protein
MKGRLVTAQESILSGQIVLVEIPGNLARPARYSTHRLQPGESWIIAKARDAIIGGEKGLVDDLEQTNSG